MWKAHYFTAIQFDHQTEILTHIDEDMGKIDFVETFSEACKTADGIHPKMPLCEVAKRWGSLKQITMSEIEMRQFTEFSRQAKWLTVRMDVAILVRWVMILRCRY
ncbi:MAG: hypothetical protein Q4B82_03460 [Alysiella sp.]|uniref:hypothetical protein n=1 Tax=Alysiella sp. TaxID=1872483 RepID=UPI0026DD2C2E|nr:hypothetical protein [Alysiella sp.]MDO4433620.1 hypothetical protein [Alysiella sp.]